VATSVKAVARRVGEHGTRRWPVVQRYVGQARSDCLRRDPDRHRVERGRASLAMATDAARTIKRHWDGGVPGFDGKIAKGRIEGINNGVRIAKTKARSYRASRNLKPIVYSLVGPPGDLGGRAFKTAIRQESSMGRTPESQRHGAAIADPRGIP